jgi:tetratricopeptide (TPR) repeat protein
VILPKLGSIVSKCSLAVAIALGLAAGAYAGADPTPPRPAPAAATACAGGDYLAARFAAEHHDLVRAADMFRRCLDRDPDNAQVLSSAFFYAVAAGRVEEGGELAKRLTSSAPSLRVAYLTLATMAMKRHDYRQAREEIAKSHKDSLPTYTIKLLDAWAAVGAGDAAAAKGILQAMHRTNGTEAVAGFNEALLADYLGETAEAEQLYRRLVEASGPSPRLVEAYGRFLERSGKAEAARALYDRVKDDQASQPVALAGKARIALGVKPEPLVVQPEDGAAEALLGVATTIGDEAGADVSVVFLRLAKYLKPNFDLVDLLIADRFEIVGNYEAAIAVYDGIRPDSAYCRIAALQSTTDKVLAKKEDLALKDVAALSAKYPDDVNVWTSYGDVLRQLKKYDEATKAYARAVALVGKPAKKNWILYFARATAEQSAGDWKSAEADLKIALKLNPDEPQILNFLGYTWVDTKQNIPQAVAMLEKANKLAPNDGYITDSVGWAYYRLGRFRDASDKLEEAVLLVPQDPTINDHLGDAYWKLGRTREAGFQWSHALVFGPEADEKTKIAKKLEEVPAGE